MARTYRYHRDLKAGCFHCHGDNAHWFGPNAQGVAVRHHDATGHLVWVDVVMSMIYGEGSTMDAINGGKETRATLAK